MNQDNRNFGRDQIIINYPSGNVVIGDSVPLTVTVSEILPEAQHWQSRVEEEEILGYLADGVRMVGIVGAGGYGKSALAAQLVKAIREKDSEQADLLAFDRVLIANFQTPMDFQTFGRWLGQKFGYEPATDWSDEQLATEGLNWLAKQRCLLVLDNLETLLQSEELWLPYGHFLGRWLGGAGQGTVLLTTQIRLELPTANWEWVTLRGLRLEQGVELLQAQGIEGETADLERFVEASGRHPLLLQLSATWLRRQAKENDDLAEIYRLQQDDVTLLRRVTEQHRDAEVSVGTVLDWSFEALEPDWLLVLLWRLSVLRQGFGLEAAQAMVDEPVELADLRRLARWSFLQEQRQKSEQREERVWQFSFLPLNQRYLRSGAAEAEEEQIAHQRAIDYFEQNGEAKPKTLEEAEPVFERFHHHCELGDYAAAHKAMGSCYGVLKRQGHDRTLLPIYEQLTQQWSAILEPSAETKQNLGWAWTNLGNLNDSLSQYELAIQAHGKAQQYFQETEFAKGNSSALGNLGNAYRALGRYQEAIDYQSQSLEIQRQIGDRNGEAASLSNLGNAYQSLGRYQEAIDYQSQSLEIKREISDRWGEAASLFNMGLAWEKLEDQSQAKRLYEEARDIFQALQLPHMVSQCEAALAKLQSPSPTDNTVQANSALQDAQSGTDIAPINSATQAKPAIARRKPPWLLYICLAITIAILVIILQ